MNIIVNVDECKGNNSENIVYKWKGRGVNRNPWGLSSKLDTPVIDDRLPKSNATKIGLRPINTIIETHWIEQSTIWAKAQTPIQQEMLLDLILTLRPLELVRLIPFILEMVSLISYQRLCLLLELILQLFLLLILYESNNIQIGLRPILLIMLL